MWLGRSVPGPFITEHLVIYNEAAVVDATRDFHRESGFQWSKHRGVEGSKCYPDQLRESHRLVERRTRPRVPLWPSWQARRGRSQHQRSAAQQPEQACQHHPAEPRVAFHRRVTPRSPLRRRRFARNLRSTCGCGVGLTTCASAAGHPAGARTNLRFHSLATRTAAPPPQPVGDMRLLGGAGGVQV
jgi:hypothetical protein